MGNFKIKPMFGGQSSGYAKSSPGQSNKDTGTKVDKNDDITQDPTKTPPPNVVAQEATVVNTEHQTPEKTDAGDKAYAKLTQAEKDAQDAKWGEMEDKRIGSELEAARLAKLEAAKVAELEEDKNNGKGQTINKKAKGRSTVLTVGQNMKDNARVKKDANQDKRLDMKLHMDAYDAEIHGTDKNAYRKEGKKVTRTKALTHRSEALKRKMAKEKYVGGQIAGSIVDTQENSNASNTDAALINQAEINTANTDKEEVVVVNDPPREKIDKKKFKETEVGKKVTGLYKKYQEKKKKRKEKKEKEKGDE
jgi:hypothetical protein